MSTNHAAYEPKTMSVCAPGSPELFDFVLGPLVTFSLLPLRVCKRRFAACSCRMLRRSLQEQSRRSGEIKRTRHGSRGISQQSTTRQKKPVVTVRQ